MAHQTNERPHVTSTSRAWRWAAIALIAAMAGIFTARAYSEALELAPINIEVLAPADEKAVPPAQPAPVQPAVRAVAAPSPAIQPSDSVEATALAIAYHALRGSDAKVTPEAIGKFAAEMMNAFSAARK